MPQLAIQPGYQPIPGYVLKDKLGSGGYGEVWSADAPGGLTKAIKFVFGSIEDSRGSAELRSLNRMRKLNHPFLLSIERVEVVESQLMIVTELAQGSLDDRFREYRNKGYLGIPRERLIRYLTDAAEGLDYLCQEHGLQHLDVKPGNLLLVADRVKVADFGLIKKLQSISQSERNGLTPTYAAPEMFDGRPSPSSDQYSLAIAYIELLSGSLPFRGRTCAQLANEHLNKAPNLEAVPLIERPVVSRALAKKPNLRYGSCREFIRALNECRVETKSKPSRLKARMASIESGKEASLRSKKRSQQKDERIASDPSQIDSSRSGARPIRLLPPFPPKDPNAPPVNEKVLYVGLGGSGGLAIQHLRMRYVQANVSEPIDYRMRALYVDTDADSVEQVLSSASLHPLPHQDTLTIRLKSPQYFRQCDSPDVQRIPRRWVFNIPRSLKTEGVRPLGLLAFLDNAKEVHQLISQTIDELYQDNDNEATLKVVLLTSAHGGTGGAIVTEVGYLIRQIAASLDLPIEVQVMLVCGYGNSGSKGGLEIASAIACMQDIQETFDSRGLHTPLKSVPQAPFFDQIPFDRVTLVHGGTLGQKNDWLHAINSMVDYAWSLHQTDLGQRLFEARARNLTRLRNNDQDTGSPWLEVLGFRELNATTYANRNASANRGCLDALGIWSSIIKKFVDDFRGIDAETEDELASDPGDDFMAFAPGDLEPNPAVTGNPVTNKTTTRNATSDVATPNAMANTAIADSGPIHRPGSKSTRPHTAPPLSAGSFAPTPVVQGNAVLEESNPNDIGLDELNLDNLQLVELNPDKAKLDEPRPPRGGESNTNQSNEKRPEGGGSVPDPVAGSGDAIPSNEEPPKQSPASPLELSWTNELFRGQQLTVSPWIRRVLATFTPIEKASAFSTIEPFSTDHGDDDPSSAYLTDAEVEGIHLIAAQLNYEPKQAKDSILNLLRVSKSQLWSWLEHSVLSSLSGWIHIGEILLSIQRRFESNVQRIEEIVAQLEEKRNARLATLELSDTDMPVEYDLMFETLTLETRLHTLAASLQANLGRSIKKVCLSWRRRCIQLHQELSATSNTMLAELGITNSGAINPSQVSALVWNPFFCEAAKCYLDYSYSGFADCWDVEPEIRRKVPIEYEDLGDVVRVVKEAVSKPRRSEITADFDFQSKGSSTNSEIAIFQDAFGWHSIYSNVTSSGTASESEGPMNVLNTPLSIDFDFNDEFRRALPGWMENGGEIRNVLVVSPRLESMFDSQHQQQIVDCRASLVRDPSCPCCSIYSIGEQMDLQDLVQHAWNTGPSMEELVQRLRCGQSGQYQVDAQG